MNPSQAFWFFMCLGTYSSKLEYVSNNTASTEQVAPEGIFIPPEVPRGGRGQTHRDTFYLEECGLILPG